MATTSVLLPLFLALSIAAAAASAASGGSNEHSLPFIPTARPSCRGSIGECMGADEFDLDSNSARRILATSNYISYDALKRDTVPCSQRGSSYYNCKPGASANPYTRGCSAISRCRSS